MARPIDEKIVALKMNIEDFKRKASEATGMFDKIKSVFAKVGDTKGFSKITDSLSGIQKAAQRVDMSTLAQSVDNVAGRFSSLDVMATTALATITNKAVNAGASLVKSLGMDQVIGGFQEYELKMGSIGTMLSNTEHAGSTLEDVKKTLGELNDYADQTVYNFGQMTQNIGRFTAAGVSLEDSATAIKGLGNLAAVSGSNTEQLNTAMYQMSQSLSSGKLNLMDWNSLVNSGMGGKKTQDALLKTADAMGVNVDKSKSFRDSISDGWLTSEVFLATLKEFGNDDSMTKAATSVRTFTQFMDGLKESIGSGWAESFELIFGDFNEATKLWTGMSDFFGGFFQKQSDARNKLLGELFDSGGMGKVFATLGNVVKPFAQILTAIGTGFKAAFPPMGATGILALVTGIEKLTSKMAFSEKTVANIAKVFEFFFSIFAFGFKVIGGIINIIVTVVVALGGLGSVIFDLIGKLVSIPIALAKAIPFGALFAGAMRVIQSAAELVAAGLVLVVQGILVFVEMVEQAWNIIANGDYTAGPWAEDSYIVDKLFDIREAVVTCVQAIVQAWNILVHGDYTSGGPWEEDSYIVDKLFDIREAVEAFVGKIIQTWNILAHGDYTAGPWDEDSYIVDKLFDIREAVEEFVGAVVQTWNILAKGDYTSGGPWDEDSEIVDKLFDLREAVVDAVNKISQAWAILTGGNYVKGPWSHDSEIVERLLTIKEAVQSAVDNVIGAWSSLAGGAINGEAIVNGVLMVVDKIKSGFSKLVDIFSGLNISMDPLLDGFIRFFEALANGFNTTIGFLKGLGTTIKNLLPSGDQLMSGGFVAGLLIIVGVALKMAKRLYEMFVGWGEIGSGVADVLGGVGGALESFAFQVKAQALLTIAIAVVVLAAGLFILAGLKWEGIAKGLTAAAVGLGILVGAMKLMDHFDIEGGGLATIVQIIALSVAFAILAGALKKLAGMSWEEIAKGIVGLVGVMGTFAGAIAIMGKFGGAKIAASSLQFIALAVSMHILLSVVKKIAEVPVEDLVKGVATLGIMLASLALFLSISKGASFGASSAVGLMGIAAAMMLMVIAIKQISVIDVPTLVKGLSVITIILGVLAGFAKLTSGTGLLTTSIGVGLVAASLLLLTVPIAILGSMDMQTLAIGLGAIAIALVAIGAASKLMTGMVAAGVGIALIAVALTLLIVPIAAFGAMSWGTLLKGMAGLAATLLILGGAALLLAPAVIPLLGFGAALLLLGAGMALAGAGLALFSTGLVTLATMTGTAVITIVAMLGTLIAGLTSLIPAAVEFMFKVMDAIADSIDTHAPVLAGKMYDAIVKVLGVMTEKVPEFVTAATNLMIAFIQGMEENIPRVMDAITSLMTALAASVELNAPIFLNAWLSIMSEVAVIMVKSGAAVIDALFGWIPGVGDVTSQIGETAELNIREAFDAQKVATDKGSEFAKNLAAAKGESQTAGSTVGKAAEVGADGANLAPIGADKGTGFATGLSGTSGAVLSSTTNLANVSEQGASTAKLNPIGVTSGNEFAGGLMSRVSAANTSGTALASGGRTGASSLDLTSSGSNFAQGFINGIRSKVDSAATTAKSLASAAARAIGKALDMHSPSRVTTKQGENTGQGFVNGIAKKKKVVAKTSAQVATEASKAFKAKMDTASYKFKMEKINSVQYIAELNKIKSSYSKYPALVQKADLEIKKIKDKSSKEDKKRIEDAEKAREEAEKKRLEAIKARFDAEKKVLDDKKYYNDLSVTQELKSYQTMRLKYKEGSDERKDIDREIYRLKNELNDKMIAINDEYVSKVQEANQKLIDGEKALNDEYNKALDDRTNSLSSFAGIFDKVTEASEVSGKELLENLQGQVVTFRKWASDIQILAAKGIDEGLIAELREMGPKSAAQIAALNTLTDDQLNQYSYLWKTKNELARTLATKELEGMKADTAKQIQELRADTAKQLDLYKKEWDTKLKEISTGTKDQFVDLKAAMTTIGGNSIRGLMDGMKNMEGPLKKQAKTMADDIAKTIRGALGIKSPSKVTTGFGEFVGEGLANGMRNRLSEVKQSAQAVANTARDSILELIDGITPKDNTIHLDVAFDSAGMDLEQYKNLKVPVTYIPDPSFARRLAVDVGSAKASKNINLESTNKDSNTKAEGDINYYLDLHYNGSGSEEDAYHMVDIVHKELGSRAAMSKTMRGVK